MFIKKYIDFSVGRSRDRSRTEFTRPCHSLRIPVGFLKVGSWEKWDLLSMNNKEFFS